MIRSVICSLTYRTVVDEEYAGHGIVFQADEAFVQSQQTRGSAKVL
jgi:hypothetical protein